MAMVTELERRRAAVEARAGEVSTLPNDGLRMVICRLRRARLPLATKLVPALVVPAAPRSSPILQLKSMLWWCGKYSVPVFEPLDGAQVKAAQQDLACRRRLTQGRAWLLCLRR